MWIYQRKETKKEVKNNLYLKKMWVAFIDIIAQEGYEFNDLIDDEGRKDLPTNIGAIAYVVVKGEDIRTAINIINKALSEKHFLAKTFFKIENLATLVENEAARKLDIQTAKRLNKSDYSFEFSGRIWPYPAISEDMSSNIWIVHAKETNFEYLNSGMKKGKIEIQEKWIYALVKSDNIEDCPYLYALGSRKDSPCLRFIDSIVNFWDYIEENSPINDNISVDAEYLIKSDKNFIYTNLSY